MATEEVVKSLDSIQLASFDTDTDRYEAMQAAKRLVARLETPFESAVSLTWADPVLLAGLKVCQDLGIWNKWTAKHKAQGNTPQTLDDILAMCDHAVEANLLRKFALLMMSLLSFLSNSYPGRFLRHLAASHTLEETAVDEWKLTPFTLALGDKPCHIDGAFAFG